MIKTYSMDKYNRYRIFFIKRIIILILIKRWRGHLACGHVVGLGLGWKLSAFLRIILLISGLIIVHLLLMSWLYVLFHYLLSLLQSSNEIVNWLSNMIWLIACLYLIKSSSIVELLILIIVVTLIINLTISLHWSQIKIINLWIHLDLVF